MEAVHTRARKRLARPRRRPPRLGPGPRRRAPTPRHIPGGRTAERAMECKKFTSICVRWTGTARGAEASVQTWTRPSPFVPATPASRLGYFLVAKGVLDIPETGEPFVLGGRLVGAGV